MDDLVRCLTCGDAASVWAPSCPACGADLSEAQLLEQPRDLSQVEAPLIHDAQPSVDGLPIHEAPPIGDALPFREAPPPGRPAGRRAGRQAARRGQRIGAAAVVVTIVVVAAVIAAIFEGPASGPAWTSALAARAVVEIHDGSVYRYSPQGSAAVSTDFADRVPRITSGPIQVSGEAVVAGGGMAFAFNGPKVTDLGPANAVIANVGGTAVWLVETPPDAPATVTLMAVTGDNEETTAQLPSDTTVLADAGQGLLVRQGYQPPMVLVPATGAVLYRFPTSFRDLVATGDPYEPHVAWRDDHCVDGDQCGLHLTNLATDSDQLLAPPPGYKGFLAGGAFSPDDTPLAFDDTVLAAFVADLHHRGRSRIDLITTPNPPSFVLSGDLPTPAVPGATPGAQWAPPGAPEGLFVAEGKRMTVLDAQARMTVIPVPPAGPFAVL